MCALLASSEHQCERNPTMFHNDHGIHLGPICFSGTIQLTVLSVIISEFPVDQKAEQYPINHNHRPPQVNIWRAWNPQQANHWQWHSVHLDCFQRLHQTMWLCTCNHKAILFSSKWYHWTQCPDFTWPYCALEQRQLTMDFPPQLSSWILECTSLSSQPSLGSLADGDVNIKLQSRQDQQKSYYDKTSKPLSPLYSQNPVSIFDHGSKTWKLVIARDESKSRRSFVVDMTDGTTLSRNRNQHINRQWPVTHSGRGTIVTCWQRSPTSELSTRSPAPKPEQTLIPMLRRSSRKLKPPEKLNLALNFCSRQ